MSICPASEQCWPWGPGWEPGSCSRRCNPHRGCWRWDSPSALMGWVILGISPSTPGQSLPAAGSPQPCAWCLAPRIPKQALPHAGAVVWSEPLPQTRANPSSSRAGCSPPAQAAWPHVPRSSLWQQPRGLAQGQPCWQPALCCLAPAQRSCKQSGKDETGAETWNGAEVERP